MIRARRFKPTDLDNIILSKNFDHEKDCLGRVLVSEGPVRTLVDRDGGIVAIIGIEVFLNTTGEVWSVMSTLVDKNKIGVVKELRKQIARWKQLLNLSRIQVTCEVNMPMCHKWFSLLGFNYESRLVRFGSNDEDYFMFARFV